MRDSYHSDRSVGTGVHQFSRSNDGTDPLGSEGLLQHSPVRNSGVELVAATNLCVADPNITTPLVLSTTTKAVFNDFGVSLNATNQVYLAYHAGTATQAAAQAAVTALQAKQNALPIVSGVTQ